MSARGLEASGRGRQRIPMLLLWGFFLWSAATVGCRRSDSETPPPLVFETGRFTSARQCGTCHRDIYHSLAGIAACARV